MRITSPAFSHNGNIPAKHTCDGENISPPLVFSEVPDGAVSLVLIMDDPDAPAGVWDHWIVFNIPPDARGAEEGKEPQGAHGVGTGGNKNYAGPCPPDREHRYRFKLYALDTFLHLDSSANKTAVEEAMSGHILADSELAGRYARSA